jgi:hypothetical protein
MSNDRTVAHGRSAHATLAWLHGRRVKSVSMNDAPQHFGVPDPKEREHVEEACRLLLSVPLGEQLAAGGSAAEHITADRPEVRRALELCRRLGPGHPVDHLEPIYENLHATLASPKVWAGISALASALLKYRTMSGERVGAVLHGAMMHGAPKGQVHALTRRIYVEQGELRR